MFNFQSRIDWKFFSRSVNNITNILNQLTLAFFRRRCLFPLPSWFCVSRFVFWGAFWRRLNYYTSFKSITVYLWNSFNFWINFNIEEAIKKNNMSDSDCQTEKAKDYVFRCRRIFYGVKFIFLTNVSKKSQKLRLFVFFCRI